MNWKEIYKSRLISVEDAVGKIESGDHISVHEAGAEPLILLDAMLKRTDLRNVVTSHMGSTTTYEAKPEFEGIFRHNSFFIGPTPYTIQAVNEGRCDITPLHLHKTAEYYSEYNAPDITLIQVSPPDAYGYVSLGISTVHSPAAIENTKRYVIAQVNKKMPVTCGESALHVSEIDYFVEADMQLVQYPMSPTGEEENNIGKNIASLIKDGDCIQLGFGGIPDAILKYLHEKKNLGVHSEMFSDNVVELVENGVINGKCKNIDRGKMVANFVIGTDKIYDFVDRNPMVVMKPVEYVNNPFVIGQIDNMVAINGCIQVDLLSQVASDTIGYTQFSSVGGQVDFVRGAAHSKGGRSILAMPSTAKGGKISRVVPILDEGAVVTTSRYDVDYIVTEFGIADLRFKTRKERTEQLISIAHPKFRDELRENSQKRNLL